MSNIINNAVNFDSICMNMTQAFQSLVSVAAKAETVDALLSIKEQLDSMMDQLDSEIDSYKDKADSSTDSNNDSVAAKAEEADFTDNYDSALTQVRNNVAKLNIIVKAIATGEANAKTHGKNQLLKFIVDCYEGFEQILAFVSKVESEGGYTFPSQVTEYIKSRQSILTTCYDNVAISE